MELVAESTKQLVKVERSECGKHANVGLLVPDYGTVRVSLVKCGWSDDFVPINIYLEEIDQRPLFVATRSMLELKSYLQVVDQEDKSLITAAYSKALSYQEPPASYQMR